MSYASTYDLSKEEQLVQRLAVSVAKTAWYIASESEATDNHALRMALVAYCGPTNADYERFARQCTIYLLAQNAGITVESSDGDLDTALAGIWNGYAAVLQAKGLIEVAV
jgi:hypothetical protein